MRKAPIRQLLLAGSFLVAASAPALALDANDMLAKLNAATEAQGNVSFTYDDVKEGSDGNLTVSGVVYDTSPDEPDTLGGLKQAEPLTLHFEGVTEDGEGGYVIDKISSSDMMFTGDEIEIKVGSLVESDVEVPPTPMQSNFAGWSYAGNTEATDILVTTNGHEVLTVDSATGTQTFSDGDSKANFIGKISGMTLDLSGIDDMDDDVRDALTALDLMKTQSSTTMTGAWDAQSGDFNISSYDIAVEDVGTLSLNFTITGMTMETINTLHALSAEMPDPNEADETEAPDAAMAQQQQLMQLGQTLGISDLAIKFTDDSISTRALQYAAEQEGLTAEEMADKIEVDLGSSLNAMNVPDLANMVTTAVGTYFSDPQTFSISIEPQMKMPVLAVIMAGAAAPQSVPQLLNLQVKAND